jgi:FkbM family methyltransferase
MLGKLLSKYTYKFGKFLAKHRKSRWAQAFGQNVKSLYFGYENHNYEFSTNGEQFLIESLSKFDINNIFDVGANVGSWSIIANEHFDNATIHSFEIVPDTYTRLTNTVNKIESINPHCIGFGDTEEVLKINYSKNASSLSGLYDVYHPDPDIIKINVKVSTIDIFCRENRIDYIDFLKIDTEGMELKILKGAEHLLRSGSIKVIQFEYGFACVDAGYLLKDVYHLLTAYGFLIGKLYPTYVDFRPYNRSMENYIGPNFVAIKKNEHQIINCLK